MSEVIGYALAIQASIREMHGVGIIVKAAFSYDAKSEQEAELHGIGAALKLWPREHGYYDHKCTSCEVTEDES